MRKIAVMLCGVPASGKSTYCRSFDEDDHMMPLIVSSDDYIDRLAAETGKTYDELFKDNIGKADDQFWKDLRTYARAGQEMIIDRTNLGVKSRKKILDVLLAEGYVVNAVWFETPEPNEWKRRLDSREGKTIPFGVLQSMAENFTVPSHEEGFCLVMKGN